MSLLERILSSNLLFRSSRSAGSFSLTDIPQEEIDDAIKYLESCETYIETQKYDSVYGYESKWLKSGKKKYKIDRTDILLTITEIHQP